MKVHMKKSNKVLIIGYICAVILVLASIITLKVNLNNYYSVSYIPNNTTLVENS